MNPNSNDYRHRLNRLRQKYREILGGGSDQTIALFIRGLKQQRGFDIANSSESEFIAACRIKAVSKKFRSGAPEAKEYIYSVWTQYYDAKPEKITVSEFVERIKEELSIDDIPRTTVYSWFSRADLKYSEKEKNIEYTLKQLAPVAIRAAAWKVRNSITIDQSGRIVDKKAIPPVVQQLPPGNVA